MNDLEVSIGYHIRNTGITLTCPSQFRFGDEYLIPSDLWKTCAGIQLSVGPDPAGAPIAGAVEVSYSGDSASVRPQNSGHIAGTYDFSPGATGMQFVVTVRKDPLSAQLRVSLVGWTMQEVLMMAHMTGHIGALIDLQPLPPPRPGTNSPKPSLLPPKFQPQLPPKPLPRPFSVRDLYQRGAWQGAQSVLERVRLRSMLQSRERTLQAQHLERLSAQLARQALELAELRAGRPTGIDPGAVPIAPV